MGGLHSYFRRLVSLVVVAFVLPACGQAEDPGPRAADETAPAAAPTSPEPGHDQPVNPLAGGAPAPANPLAGHGPAAANPLAGGGTAPASLHGEFAALNASESGRVKETLGATAGVRVSRVTAGGPLAAAGLRVGDVLVALGGAAIRSPGEAVARLAPGAGDVAAAWLRPDASGEWAIHQGTVRLPGTAVPPPASPVAAVAPPAGGGPPPAATPATGVAPAPAAVDRSLTGCVTAWFRMLDFCRSEAWGRPSETPEAAVRHATGLLRECLGELSAEQRTAVGQFPDAWAQLQQKWQAASPELREKQRQYWRDQTILPNPLLPFPGETTQYRSNAGYLSFDHPARWPRAQTEDEGARYLFVGPAAEASWEQVGHPATAPAGALFVIAPLEDDVRAAKTLEAAARLLARKYVTAYAPGLREVAVFRAGPGAVAVLRGARPGETHESLCWLGAMPFGSAEFLAVRMLGPVSRAEELLPAFTLMLTSLQVIQVDEGARLEVSLAAAMIGNAVVSAGWSH